MNLHSGATEQHQTVTGYFDGAVEDNAFVFEYSLSAMPEPSAQARSVAAFTEPTGDHFEAPAAAGSYVFFFGTIACPRFIHPRLIVALSSRRIVVECMNNQAGCNTCSILMGEGRKVTLALTLGAADAR